MFWYKSDGLVVEYIISLEDIGALMSALMMSYNRELKTVFLPSVARVSTPNINARNRSPSHSRHQVPSVPRRPAGSPKTESFTHFSWRARRVTALPQKTADAGEFVNARGLKTRVLTANEMPIATLRNLRLVYLLASTHRKASIFKVCPFMSYFVDQIVCICHGLILSSCARRHMRNMTSFAHWLSVAFRSFVNVSFVRPR